MAIWAMADLHLSLGTDKPMDNFRGWYDYVNRIEQSWRESVKPEDTVVIPGDFSWGIDLEEALPDFQFIEALPGKKLVMKGNHDYWWTTRTKAEKFFTEKGLKTIGILHNNSVLCEGKALCGTRGWVFMPNEAHDLKISAREAARLELSLKDSLQYPDAEKIVFLHYPPVYANEMVPNIFDVLYKYGVKRVYYGHIHGNYEAPAKINYADIDFYLVSADYLMFDPLLIQKNVDITGG